MNKLLNISEVSNIVNLVDPITKKPLNHILRYWEKEFRQIRPKKINNRRYYSSKDVELIKKIKFLLKNEGMTISGVKSILKKQSNKLDDHNKHSLKADYYKNYLKEKSRSLLKKVNRIKNNGKKNSS
jgi:DNA-binding transcriptional MerR regulator